VLVLIKAACLSRLIFWADNEIVEQRPVRRYNKLIAGGGGIIEERVKIEVLMRVIICAIMILTATSLYAADVTIWIGNQDGSPLVWRTDSVEKIPVWIKTNSDVYIAATHIPIATDDRYVSKREGAELYPPFKQDDVPAGYDKAWDSIFSMDTCPLKDKPGFTSQGLVGFMDLAGRRNLPLHCEEVCRPAEFIVKTVAVDSLRGHTYDVFCEGYQEQNKGYHFSDTLGARTFTQEAHYSQVYFVYPGDINDDNVIDTNDLTDLEAFLAGKVKLPWPESRADINNDGNIDKQDLAKLQEILAK
jgi:hypothetical protein